MNELIAKAKILLRAEKALYRAEAQRRANEMLLSVVASGCFLVALIFINMGLFFELTEVAISSRAAFILAAGNLCLGFIPFQLKRRIKPGPEEAMMQEIREITLEEISQDLDAMVQELAGYGADIKQLVSSGSGLGGNSLQTLGTIVAMINDLMQETEDISQDLPEGMPKETDDDRSRPTAEI